MSCEFVTNHLIYYLLGELPPRDRRMVEQHVPKCIVCSEALNGSARDITAITEAMKTTLSAPMSMAERVMARVAAEPPARRRPVLWRWRTLAVGALAMAALLFLLLWVGIWRSVPVSLVELEKDHDRSEQPSVHQQFPTTVPEQAAKWLQRESGVAVRPMDFREHGAELVGAHVCEQGRQTVAAMLYRAQDEDIGFYQFDAQGWQAPAHWKVVNCPHGCKVYSGRIGDCRVVTWNDGTLGYSLISCGGEDKLLELANHALTDHTTTSSRPPS